MKKRLISLLLALCVMLSCLPIPIVGAEEFAGHNEVVQSEDLNEETYKLLLGENDVYVSDEDAWTGRSCVFTAPETATYVITITHANTYIGYNAEWISGEGSTISFAMSDGEKVEIWVAPYDCCAGTVSFTLSVQEDDTPAVEPDVSDPNVSDIVADGVCGFNLTWSLDENGTLIISGTGAMREYSYNDVPWYSKRSSVNTIVIGTGVTSVGDYAFYACENLTDVIIPEGVTSIGCSAFEKCSSLTSVTIPESVDNIGNSAFSECSSLTSVTIPEGVASIERWTFSHCGKLTSVIIPDSVTTIGTCAFSYCTKLESVIIPDSVTTIESNAFFYCEGLSSVTIGKNVSKIGDNAFGECDSHDVYITDLVAWCNISFGNTFSNPLYGGLYLNGELLTELEIPLEVKNLRDFTFSGCESLTSVIIPNGVTSIGKGTFQWCTNLLSITIPDGVTSIGEDAFDGCTSLWHILYTGTEEQWNTITIGSINNNLTAATRHYSCTGDEIVDGECTICNPLLGIIDSGICGDNLTWVLDSNGTLTISGEGEMENYYYSDMPWYSNCSSIIAVVIGDGVTSVGEYAFRNCSSLTSISIPDSVTSLGEGAFRNCSSLTGITIPNGVTSIGSYAFGGCSSLVYNVYDNAKYLGNSENPYVALIEASSTSITSCSIHEGTKVIADWAFDCCDSLTSVRIPASVTHVGIGAFANCDYLNAVYISDIVAWCKLNFVSGPSNPLYYAKNLYLNEELVTDLVIPCGVTSIGDYAFAGCNLTSVTVPDGVTVINRGTFEGCESLRVIILPASIEKVDVGAFFDKIYAPSSVIPEIEVWHVLYRGTESQRAQIGSFLEDAIWHYEYTDDEIIDPKTQYCSICERNCPHKWDDGVRTKLPTETETGILTFTCSICGETKAEEIPKVSNPAGIEDLQYEIENGEVTITGCDITAGGNLVIPETIEGYPVTTIGYRAFYECANLFSVTIPEGVTYIAKNAFSYCDLVYIVLPESLKQVSLDAFRNGTSSFYAGVFAQKIEIGHVLYRGTQTQEWDIETSDGGDISPGDYGLPRGTWHYECTGDEIVDGVCSICNPPYDSGDADGDGEVNTDDAIYVLYNVMFGDEDYPVTQNCDFDGNGEVNTDDAIYLLYHIMFGETDYPLHG